jgi:hypothetical protein
MTQSPLRAPLFELVTSVVHADEYPVWNRTRWRYLRDYARWTWDAWFGPIAPAQEGNERLTVILLNYKRPRNIEPIVRSILKAACVERVLVSNHNPRMRIRDWISLADPRIELLDQPLESSPGLRFQIAAGQPGSYFLAIDDDVFLYPGQVSRLFSYLQQAPSVPHGIQGEIFREAGIPGPDGDLHWETNIQRVEREVDVINRVYGFTKAHALEYCRLIARLGIEVRRPHGDDILISCSGDGKPRCHDVGWFGECLSSHRRSVATWRARGFFEGRDALYRRVCAERG